MRPYGRTLGTLDFTSVREGFMLLTCDFTPSARHRRRMQEDDVPFVRSLLNRFERCGTPSAAMQVAKRCACGAERPCYI